jgi:cytochrome c-type biogenesis protein CcmH/NrfG
MGVLFGLYHAAENLDDRFYPRSERSLLAFGYYLTGDYAKAARLYRADLAARLHPSAPRWWAAFLAGDVGSAERLLRNELQRSPDDPDALLGLAEIALADRRWPQTIALATKVLERRRDDYDALFLVALAHARQGTIAEAISALNRALRYNRTETSPTIFLAALELTGELDDAPTTSRCLLAHLHRYLRIYDSSHARIAEKYARAAIAAGDHVDAAYVTLGVIFEKTGHRRYALDSFRSGAQVNPRNVHALRGAARQHAHRGEVAEEYRFLKQSFEAAPEDPLVVNGYQALALDRAAVARNPRDSEAWWRLGTVQSYLGDHAAALGSHRRAADLAPDDARFQDHIAHELFLLDRLDDAQAVYQQSIKTYPYRPAPHAGLATIHAKRERWHDARREYEVAFTLGGNDVEILVNLCQVYQALLDNQRAFNCLSAVLTKDPDNVRARVLLEHAGKALAAAVMR